MTGTHHYREDIFTTHNLKSQWLHRSRAANQQVDLTDSCSSTTEAHIYHADCWGSAIVLVMRGKGFCYMEGSGE